MFQDQAKVQQILNNLLSNAIKFTPEGGRIVVSRAARAAGDVRAQSGRHGRRHRRGRPGRDLREVPPGQVGVLAGGDAMTREYSGTGLGLSIVKELCKLLGGEITLDSELGKGSTFTVRLPLAVRPAQERVALAHGRRRTDQVAARRISQDRSAGRHFVTAHALAVDLSLFAATSYLREFR